MAKSSTKKTGVNAGIEAGIPEQRFSGKVICKKCGKEVEYTLGSRLFEKCPRCGARMERDIAKEEQQAGKIVKADILSRSKRTQLHIGFLLTAAAIVYNITGFFTHLFDGQMWWLALVSLPFVVVSFFLMRGTRTGSASKLYRFYAWLALVVNFVAILLIIATAVPPVSEAAQKFFKI
jgi:DNA-directed RNA polymerase subunit RPC12/RpoP